MPAIGWIEVSDTYPVVGILKEGPERLEARLRGEWKGDQEFIPVSAGKQKTVPG